MNVLKLMAKGVKWNSLSSLIAALSKLVIMLALAYSVGPKELGILTLALIWVRLSLPVIDLGLGNGYIQASKVNQVQFSTLFWLQQAIAVILTLVTLFIASRFIAFFFMEAAVAEVLFLFSPLFIFASPGLMHLAMLKKALRFDDVAKIQIWSSLFELLVGLVLLYLIGSISAIAYAYLAKYGMTSILSIYFTKGDARIVFNYNYSSCKPLVRFGLYDIGNQLSNQFSTQIDKLIIGKLLGTVSLGYYALAWDIMVIPLGRVSAIFNQAAFPIFSKIKKDHDLLGQAYHFINKNILYIILPIFGTVALLSQPVVMILFGEAWVSCAPILSILLVAGIYKSISSTGNSLILAHGRSDYGFYWNIFWTAGLSLFIVIGIYLRPSEVSVAWAVLLGSISLGWIWHWLIWKVGQFEYRSFFINLIRGLFLFLPSLILILILKPLVNEWLALNIIIFLGSIGLCSYLLMTYIFERSFIREIRKQYHI